MALASQRTTNALRRESECTKPPIELAMGGDRSGAALVRRDRQTPADLLIGDAGRCPLTPPFSTHVRSELGVHVFWSRSARPQSYCPVTAAGGNAASVGAERHTADTAGVARGAEGCG